jgi:hypothetical protein
VKASVIACLLILALGSPAHGTGEPVDTATCPVSRGGEIGSGDLKAVLPTLTGKLVFRPGGVGFVDHDGALGIKVLWKRGKKGRLSLSGSRLDGEAGPARAYLNDYGDTGIQPSYLVFPTPGCWKITGGVADARLTFVLLVEKIGEGPAWRFDGLEPGWRVTSTLDES